ncbi:hypothetical protein BDR03DRAFT_971556 [Suillus americanus]|nr:hypothetical protein BDR03DRAFT_971556 [Suillus americanus]
MRRQPFPSTSDHRTKSSLLVHFCLDPNTPWSIAYLIRHHIYKAFSFFEQRDSDHDPRLQCCFTHSCTYHANWSTLTFIHE